MKYLIIHDQINIHLDHGVGEMVQLVNGWLVCKPDSLRSEPRNACEKPGIVAYKSNSSARAAGQLVESN